MAGIQVLSAAPATLGAIVHAAGAELRNAPDGAAPALGACIDSRTAKPGQVFVALRGEHTDGHRFVAGALRAGAAAALVGPDWDGIAAGTGPLLVADDPQSALQRWAKAHREAFEIPVVAVAGSNGKTTTRSMLGHILSSLGPSLATEGNLNNHLGVPLTLLRLTAEHRAAAVEMGINHAGELTALCEIAAPTSGVITNAGREHLEGLGTPEAAAKAEFELAEYLLRNGGQAVVNGDDALLMSFIRGRRVRTFGMGPGCDVRAEGVGTGSLQGSRFRIAGGPEVKIALPGAHNVMNALAALAAAATAGVSLDDAAAALASYPGTEHGRLELLELGGLRILDDTYNANPDSVRAALAVLKSVTVEGRRLVALGDMLELGGASEAEHEAAGSLLEGVDTAWLAGQFAPAVARGARGAGVAHIEMYPDSKELASSIHGRLRPGDLLLVKGSRGTRMERVVEALKQEFSR